MFITFCSLVTLEWRQVLAAADKLFWMPSCALLEKMQAVTVIIYLSFHSSLRYHDENFILQRIIIILLCEEVQNVVFVSLHQVESKSNGEFKSDSGFFFGFIIGLISLIQVRLCLICTFLYFHKVFQPFHWLVSLFTSQIICLLTIQK